MKKIMGLLMIVALVSLTGCFNPPDYNKHIENAKGAVSESNEDSQKLQDLNDTQMKNVEEMEKIIGE